MVINNIAIALLLFLLAAVLFLAVQFRLISDQALQRLTNVTGTVAAVAAIIIIVLPPIDGNSSPPASIAQVPVPPTDTPKPTTIEPTSTSTFTPTFTPIPKLQCTSNGNIPLIDRAWWRGLLVGIVVPTGTKVTPIAWDGDLNSPWIFVNHEGREGWYSANPGDPNSTIYFDCGNIDTWVKTLPTRTSPTALPPTATFTPIPLPTDTPTATPTPTTQIEMPPRFLVGSRWCIERTGENMERARYAEIIVTSSPDGLQFEARYFKIASPPIDPNIKFSGSVNGQSITLLQADPDDPNPDEYRAEHWGQWNPSTNMFEGGWTDNRLDLDNDNFSLYQLAVDLTCLP